jgi:hypothetical protein
MSLKHITSLLLPLVLGSSGFAQNISSPYCPAGLMPDGSVDWRQLPASPTTGGVSVTVPVTGAPGLTATLAITNPTPPFNPGGNGPKGTYYTVNSSSSITMAMGSNPTIIFNKPVKGVSAQMSTQGRFGHIFQMTASNRPITSPFDLSTTQNLNAAPPDQQVITNGSERGAGGYVISPLTIRSMETNIYGVIFSFSGDPNEGYFTFDLTNLRVDTGSSPDPGMTIPTNGLREWFRADNAQVTDSFFGIGSFTVWHDQSGNGNDATAVPGSSIPGSISGPNCTPVVSFTGSQSLTFNQNINGLTGMTVFMASQAYDDSPGWWQNQALMWPESEQWGTTFFTPSQSNVFFRFGTTQVNNQPIRTRVSPIGGDFTITTAIHNGTTDSLWVNGQLALQQGGKQTTIAGTLPTAQIGSGLLGTYFTGNIGEIIIYDRALTKAERETVQHYLTGRYGIH